MGGVLAVVTICLAVRFGTSLLLVLCQILGCVVMSLRTALRKRLGPDPRALSPISVRSLRCSSALVGYLMCLLTVNIVALVAVPGS